MFLMILVWAVMAALAVIFFLSFPPIWPVVIIILLWYAFKGWPEPGSRQMTDKEREALGPHIKEREQ